MLAYHKDDNLSPIGWELLRETERGLTGVAAALPGLSIAGGYFHLTYEPLTLIPHVFLLDEEEKHVIDALNGNDCHIISYYVAGTLSEGGAEELMNSIRATGEKLTQEGFRILDKPENLQLFL